MRHLKAIRPIPFLIALLALLATACSDLGGPAAGEPEDPGVLLVPRYEGGYYAQDLVWTRDGTELLYVKAGMTNVSSTVLNAVNVSTHAVRQLYTSPFITSLARESAATRIYVGDYLTTVGVSEPNFQVSRVHLTTGAVEVLATTFLGNYNVVLVSDDERFLVAPRGLYDLQTASRIDLPAGLPIGFSPDKTQLLYFLDQTSTVAQSPTLISTADGSSRLLHSTGDFYLAHRWAGNSPQLLKKDFEFTGGGTGSTIRLSEIDGVTGATREIAEFVGAGPGVQAAWSADGRTLGVWIDEGSIAERTDRTSLYVIRAGSAPTVVATVHGAIGQPVLSPNGSSVAYFYFHDNDRRSLYMTGI
jgi:hypothetical protein